MQRTSARRPRNAARISQSEHAVRIGIHVGERLADIPELRDPVTFESEEMYDRHPAMLHVRLHV